MCITMMKYTCGHIEEEFKQCKRYRERAKAAHRKKSGFWKYIFKRVPAIKCDAPPGEREVMDRKCGRCIARTREGKAEREARRREERNQAEFEMRHPEDFARRRSEVKWAWTCESCAAERRESERWQRAANGGACCARGLDEFDEWERRQRALGTRALVPHNTHHRAERPRAPTRDEKQPHPRRTTNLEEARRDARAAATRYGWADDPSSELSPDVAKGFMTMLGSDSKALTYPPNEPQPLYEEPGINWDRWNQSTRTAYGNYPPPAPPPDIPLPVRPLARRSTGVQGRVTRPVEPHRNFSVPRKPVPASSPDSAPDPARATRVVNPERPRRIAGTRGRRFLQQGANENGVSPPSSPVSSMGSPVLRSARSTISSLNHQIDSTMEYFQEEPPRPVLR